LKTSDKPSSSSGVLVFSHIEVPRLKDIQKREARGTEAIEVTSSEENDQSDDGEEKPVRRLSRKVSKMAVYNVDSDAEEERPTKAARVVKKKPRSESPEFIVSDSDEDDDRGDSIEVSDGEDSDAPKSKSLAKSKAKPKASAKSKGKARASDREDVMDVDEAVSTSGTSSKSKKRKRVEKEEKPKERREAKDPWKLRGAAKRDWKQMQSPPMEMFHFARKVVDEYTYLDGKIHSLVTRLSADRHWVLSGTPPIHDFAAVKTIAAHLNLHLGIDDDNEGKSVEVKKRRREQTGKSVLTLSQLHSDCVSTKRSRSSTHSGKRTAWIGTLIVMSSGRNSWIGLSVRCVWSAYSCLSN
jgi:hypothetical protein